MPQVLFRGKSASAPPRRLFRKLTVPQALSAAVEDIVTRASSMQSPLIENLESRELLSTTYFVATTGSDTNTGTMAAPFRTIQRAANVAQSGDAVDIRAGTYRETVTPKHSGVTFQPYDGEHVTISGADQLSGWTNYSGSIYQAPMSVNLGEGNNEVFVNGQEINEARFPNTSLNISDPTTEKIQSVKAGATSATIYDSNLTQATNYWKGAEIHIDPGQAWVDQVGTVTSSAPGQITISYAAPSAGQMKYALPVAGNEFYLVGKFQALNTAGEWYRDPGTGKVYVWTPSGNNPASDDVEVKSRKYAFDLGNVSNITIKGINIFGATIHTTATSKNVVLNGITAQYISQFFALSNGWWTTPTNGGGIMLMGTGDVLENSTIAYASGDGVVVDASGVTVHNNVIHDVDTIGGDMAGIRVLAGGAMVDHNTIYNTGRDGIEASVPRVQILYNTVHDVGLQTTEAGGIYTVNTNGQNAVIAYNYVYSIHEAGYGGTAIFLDNSSNHWIVDNNVTSDVDYGMKMNFTSVDNQIYNNTLGATIRSISSNQIGNWNGTSIHNNIFAKGVVLTGGASVTNNITGGSSTKSVGAAKFTSGASGTSTLPPVTIPPITTPPVTTPPVTTPTPTPSTTAPSAKTKLMAVKYNAHNNVKGDNFGGVGYAYNNSYVAYKLNFGTGVTKFTGGVAAIYGSGSIEIHLGSPTGTLVGTLKASVTGAWNRYTSQSTAVHGLTGVQTVYLVFKGPYAGVANLDWIQFS